MRRVFLLLVSLAVTASGCTGSDSTPIDALDDSATTTTTTDAVVTTAAPGDAGDDQDAPSIWCDGAGSPILLNPDKHVPLDDDLLASMRASGIRMASPERWVRATTDADATDFIVVFDPDPLSSDPDSYWVRSGSILDGGFLPSYDGVCSHGPRDGTFSVSSCSVTEPTAPIGGPTVIWETAGNGDGTVEISVNGGPALISYDGSGDGVPPILLDRVREHGDELVNRPTGVDPGGVFGNFGAPQDIDLSYTATAIDSQGNRAEPFDCGTVVFRSKYPAPECSVALEQFPVITLQGDRSGLVQVYRNGEVMPFTTYRADGTYEDTAAPAAVDLLYTARLNYGDGTYEEGVCGTVVLENEPDLPDLLELVAQRSASTPAGPYWYSTLIPVCPDCDDATEVTVHHSAIDENGGFNGRLIKVWVNRDATEPTGDPWEIFPPHLAQHLIDAQEDGAEVGFTVSDDRSAVTAWTVDGVGARYVCSSADTAPLDLRTPWCEPTYD